MREPGPKREPSRARADVSNSRTDSGGFAPAGQFEEARQEAAEPLLGAAALQRRGRVRSLDLLDVEADRVDAVFLVEVEQLVGVVERVGGQHGDDEEGHALFAEQADASQHAIQRPLAAARAPLAVVQESRPVHADAGLNVVAQEEAHQSGSRRVALVWKEWRMSRPARLCRSRPAMAAS